MRRRSRLLLVLMLGTYVALAQVPSIQKVDPLTAHPNDTILITGSGFSASPADLEVWFDQVKGEVIASSEFAIEVIVPPQARLSTVEVIHRASFASAKSNLKFMPTFQGAPFDAARFDATLVEGENIFTAPEELWDLCTSDLNVDGKPDIVATKFQSAAFFATSSDMMILQNVSTPGNLDFERFEKNNMPVLGVNFPTDNVVAGDLQGDGKPELVFSRAGSTRNSIHILRNTSIAGGAISFAAPFTTLALDAGHVATRIRIRDLNRDGKPEIIVSNTFNSFFYIFINQSSGGTLSYNPTPLKFSVKVFDSDPSSTNYEVEVQDFNGDDRPDLVVNEFQEDSLHIFTNTSTGAITFGPRITVPTVEKLNRLSSVDINNDGKLDLLATSTLNSQLLYFLNQTTGSAISFSAATPLNTGTGTWGVDVADIDGDGDPDLLNVNRDQNQINIFIHNGNFSSPAFTRADFTTPNDGRNLKVADMDGDGKPDLVYTSFNTGVTPNSSAVEIVRNTNCHRPEIANPLPVVVCNGQTINLEAKAAENVTFTWRKDNVVVGGNEHLLSITAPGAAGSYTVTATSEGGACEVTTPVLSVTEDTGNAPANPVITANTPMCTGADLQLGTDPVAGGIYAWTGPNGFTSALEDPVVPGMTQDQAGFYELQVTVDVCKSHVSSVRVDVADLADFAITSSNATNTVCAGGSVVLSVNDLDDHTYQWKLDGANIITGGQSATFTATAEGDYSVDVTNTALSCTTEIGPVAVTVLEPPVAAYTVQATACTGEEIPFTNESVVDGRATVIYTWNFDDGNTVQEEDPAKAYAAAGVFDTSLEVEYSGVAGCSDVAAATVTVTEAAQPNINSSETSLCPEGAATLAITGPFAEVLWSTAETENSITVTGPGTYSVTTTDNNGCTASDEVTIAALPVPEITATAEPATIPLYATSQLGATPGLASYSWDPAETLDDPFIANPVATPTATTTYIVTGRNAENCAAQAEVTVTIEGVLGFPITFSPNGDGINDEWNIRAQDKPECTLSVFDGRGRRVFEGQGRNWDGTYNGNAVPNGTYYYVFGCPNEKPATGNVLIIK